MSVENLYINNIDECINNIIDTFYINIKKNIESISYIKDNFNIIINNISNIIDKSIKQYKLKNIIIDNYDIILKIFNDYILLYIFLYLGTYNTEEDLLILINYINDKYDLKLYKNKYITQYSIYYKIINDYLIVIKNIDNQDIIFLEKYKNIIESISIISKEILISDSIYHNIIKIIIFKEIYIKEDKVIIYKILEQNELKNIEYKYIEIIDELFDVIDYAAIESNFSSNNIKNYNIDEIYELLQYNNKISINDNDSKIDILFNNNILIPITDEFLRYHKEQDLFDKSNFTKIDNKERNNKKDNTKIRYIITKINKIKDFYVNNNISNTEVDKYFYQPYLNRKAIIINDIEEIQILKKFELLGKDILNNNQYYNEFVIIKNYPYINFKFLKNDNFIFNTSKTVNAIRYCNFEFKNDKRFVDFNKLQLQLRIINNNISANIVGIALPTNNFLTSNKTILQCISLNNTINIRDQGKNAYKLVIHKLKNLFLNNKKYNKLHYWIFDKNKDLVNIDNLNELSSNEYTKVLLANIYDEIIIIIYKFILNKLEKIQYNDIEFLKKIIREVEKETIFIPRESNLYSKLMKYILYIKPKININLFLEKNIKLNNSDTIYKLPNIYAEKIKLHIISINKNNNINLVNDNFLLNNYICQHNITWNKIHKLKKKDINKYNIILNDFIKQYIIENNNNEYICKSCNQLINLTKFTTEIYPGSESYILSYGLDSDLELMNEYSKYSNDIKKLEKIIEKISYGINIVYYIGSSQQAKYARQDIIKNLINLININYKTLFISDKENRTEILKKSIKKYGCSLTNFFNFEFDNENFSYSSKETDIYKLLKINNMYIYIILLIILELNFQYILNFKFEKNINYFLFTKYGYKLFDNLNILLLNNNELIPIKNYKLLCYVIYYISAVFIKYNLWYTDINNNKKIINPQIQKNIIHTFVHALNTILEVNNNDYIYKLYKSKFYNILNNIYNDTSSINILNKLDLISKKNIIITDDNKLKFNIIKLNPIEIIDFDFEYNYCMQSILGTNEYIMNYPNIKFINNKLIDKSKKILSEKKMNEINEKLKKDILLNTAKLYSLDGLKRKMILNDDQLNKLSNNDLIQITNKSNNIRLSYMINTQNIINNKLEKIKIKNINNLKYLKKLIKDNNSNSNITNLFNLFQKSIGTNINININNNNYHLFNNIYIINHNYMEAKIKPFIIFENDSNFQIIKNDSNFKQDIYSYYDSINKVTLYYSYIEKYFIGFKENSKDIIYLINTDCYIHINYSIFYQLKLLGFNNIFSKINNNVKNLNIFINNILQIRLQNLKNSISYIQQIIYQIKNKFNGSHVIPISKFYQSKIISINTYDNNNNRIFKDWNIINNNLFIDKNQVFDINLDILPNNNKYLSTESIIKLIFNNDTILNYIIEQFIFLLEINDNTNINVNITYLIINIIINIFNNLTKLENSSYNINIKKFNQKIQNSDLLYNISDIDDINALAMTEEELEKYKEEIEVNKELFDALDADQDDINDDFGEEDILLVDRTDGDY